MPRGRGGPLSAARIVRPCAHNGRPICESDGGPLEGEAPAVVPSVTMPNRKVKADHA
jgi:hypothetical protein